jgi:hypothetical protein
MTMKDLVYDERGQRVETFYVLLVGCELMINS